MEYSLLPAAVEHHPSIDGDADSGSTGLVSRGSWEAREEGTGQAKRGERLRQPLWCWVMCSPCTAW